MAGKEKVDVQGYLAKHKVAALFEVNHTSCSALFIVLIRMFY